MPLAVGSTFGSFRILALAGRGGMGEVYRAEDTTLGRVVALKTIRVDEGEISPLALGRFQREARMLAWVAHPNTVAIYGLDEIEGTPVLVMEWVDGTSLRALMLGNAAPLGDRVRWIRELAVALSALHERGIVHRDVKPSNVMIDRTGRARLLDFGIARFVEADRQQRLTGTHEVIGTPRYMAPEQLLGAVDACTDQFAWGLIAYELLTGAHARDRAASPPGGGAADAVWAPPPLASFDGSRVAPEVGRTILRALAANPNDRFSSMAALLSALDAATPNAIAPSAPPTAAVAPRRSRTTRRSWVVFGASLLTVLALGIIALTAAWVRRGPAPVVPTVVAPPPPPTHDANDATDVGDAGDPDDVPSSTDGGAPEPDASVRTKGGARSSRRVVGIRFDPLWQHESIDEASSQRWLARHEPDVLSCYRRIPPVKIDPCVDQDLECTFGRDGVVACKALHSSHGWASMEGDGACNSDARRGACVAAALSSTDGPALTSETMVVRTQVNLKAVLGPAGGTKAK